MIIEISEQMRVILVELLESHEREMYDLAGNVSHDRMRKVAQEEAELVEGLRLQLEEAKQEGRVAVIQTSPFPPKSKPKVHYQKYEHHSRDDLVLLLETQNALVEKMRNELAKFQEARMSLRGAMQELENA